MMQNNLTNLNQNDFFTYTRGTIPLYRAYMVIKSIHDRASELLGMKCDFIVYAHENGKLWWSWSDKEIRLLGEKIWEKTATKQGSEKHLSEIKTLVDHGIHHAEVMLTKELSMLDNEDLVREHHRFYLEIRDAFAVLNLDVDAVDIFPAEQLKQQFNKQVSSLAQNTFEEVYRKVTSPYYTSYVTEEQKHLLKFYITIKDNNLSVNTLKGTKYYFELDALKRKFWWTSLGWEHMNAKDISWYTTVIKDYEKEYPTSQDAEQKLHQLEHKGELVLEQRKQLFKQYKIPPALQQRIQLFDSYAHLHDLRKEMQMKCAYAFDQFLLEFGKRLKLNVAEINYLNYYTYEELYDLILGKKTFDCSEAKQRFSAQFLVTNNSQMQLTSGKEAQALIKKYFKLPFEKTAEIKGVCSSPGKIQGTVKVCAGSAEAMKKITKGDVLVTGMTLPDYVPAMKTAAAIVTDEGGITCHAAIISRELGIPCITSTKIATQLLKDGMKVEVDADRGIIRII